MQYIFNQGIGQIALNNKAKNNEEVLKDPTVRKEYKDKIKKIIQFKKYFYQFFKLKESRIYSRTAILEDDAVVYLVIGSHYREIKAKQFSFPIMGSFPYLGFFSKEKALKFAKELEEEDFITYVRPVYAYSTLGYFEDSILSSFFQFDDQDLAELIFHELFHTIFFIKDEVELNENLANFFAEKMLFRYFDLNKKERMSFFKKKKNEDLVLKEMVTSIETFDDQLKSLKPKSKNESLKMLEKFLEEDFYPHMLKVCSKLDIEEDHCFPMRKGHNHASFSQLLTYEGQSDKIKELYDKLNLSLFEFLDYLKEKDQAYKNSDLEISFSKFLFNNS